MNTEKYQQLKDILAAMDKYAVAVSGGVDSMTLAIVAHRVSGHNATIVHAVSAAVPVAATERIRQFASEQGWNLVEINAGEMANPDYQRNPVNRCYHCKSCLYSSINALALGTVLSGTNLDDLDDYRPGLIAAKEQSVRHPFVEAQISKQELREIARDLGYDDLADLPASPCLSSRVETGIPIPMVDLSQIDAIEVQVRTATDAENVRCRVRSEGVVIELDQPVLDNLPESQRSELLHSVQGLLAGSRHHSVTLSAYDKGSAFLVTP